MCRRIIGTDELLTHCDLWRPVMASSQTLEYQETLYSIAWHFFVCSFVCFMFVGPFPDCISLSGIHSQLWKLWKHPVFFPQAMDCAGSGARHMCGGLCHCHIATCLQPHLHSDTIGRPLLKDLWRKFSWKSPTSHTHNFMIFHACPSFSCKIDGVPFEGHITTPAMNNNDPP